MHLFGPCIRMFLWLTVVTGILYPLGITGIAQLMMKHNADGQFIALKEGKTVGAIPIGQKFESDRYFWGRPSAIDYNPLPSGGSNLGPTSKTLAKAVEERKGKIRAAQKLSEGDSIPSELLYASGSGLDPHLTLAAARFQVPRIAQARHIEEGTINQMIDIQKTSKLFGFIGDEYVNVLLLNLALDDMQQGTSHHE